MGKLAILLVGSTTRDEFADAVGTLERFGQVVRAADLAEATQLVAAGRVRPDLIVVAQAFPGQFRGDALERLCRAAPLSRLVGLLGSWCEGETRTGSPWPAAIRVYWHQWQPGAVRELERLAAGSGSTWSLPVTASEEERLLALAEQPIHRRQGRIGIWASQWAMLDWLQAACLRRGYTPLAMGPRRAAPAGELAAVIFDAADGPDWAVHSLEQLAAARPSVPIVALMDFPRAENHQRLFAAGAAAVLSKPLLLDDLFWQLDQFTSLTQTL
ncbi:MAG TPA: response regulator [Planctomycetaceae bacterium]|nr:response regulator [Planctomycetaceae bacterium]HIQ22337.1 response regulator [Planctomycetota bacterium]